MLFCVCCAYVILCQCLREADTYVLFHSRLEPLSKGLFYLLLVAYCILSGGRDCHEHCGCVFYTLCFIRSRSLYFFKLITVVQR